MSQYLHDSGWNVQKFGTLVNLFQSPILWLPFQWSTQWSYWSVNGQQFIPGIFLTHKISGASQCLPYIISTIVFLMYHQEILRQERCINRIYTWSCLSTIYSNINTQRTLINDNFPGNSAPQGNFLFYLNRNLNFTWSIRTRKQCLILLPTCVVKNYKKFRKTILY